MRRVWLALCLAPLPAAISLAQDGYFSSSDGMIHLYRLFELDRALRAGIFYPRWFPLSGYGYGLPVLNYYSPLSYYVAELFHLAGAGYIVSLKLLIAFGFLAAAFSMFLFARDLLGDAPALVAAVAYAYLPYLLSDAYVRGNFPEFLAMSILPLVLWAFRRVFDHRRVAEDAEKKYQNSLRSPRLSGDFVGQVLFAALAFGAIVLIHHLTAMLIAALLLAYIPFLFAMYRDWTRLLASAAAVLLALALSAFYWLPALGELNLVYVGPASVARFLVNRLVSLTDFFAPSLAYVYLPQSEVLKHAAGFPQTMIALVVGIVGLVVMLRHRGLNLMRHTRHELRITFCVLFFFPVTVASIFMTLTFSAPLWYAIPTLRFMQFPWRFQILAGIGIAFLIGIGAKWIAELVARFRLSGATYAVSSIAFIALGIANLPVRTFPLTDAQVNLLHSSDPDYVVAQMGWSWTREFVPATVQNADSVYAPVAQPNVPMPDPARAVPTIQIVHDGLLAESLRVAAPQPLDISLHTFYFPEWQAYIDGAPARTYPRGSLGLVSVTVPPGDHTVSFQFQDTLFRTAANLISLLSALGVFAWLVIAHRRAAVAVLGATILIAALWFLRAQTADAALPTPLSENLDNRAMLIGYTADRVNETMYVTLYWFALGEMDKNYHVSVHLVDSNDYTVAQQDAPPDQGLTPTTRWMPGEVIVDHHALALTSLKPGEYRLTAAMYLPLDNSYANLGTPVELGRVKVDQ